MKLKLSEMDELRKNVALNSEGKSLLEWRSDMYDSNIEM